MKTHVILKIVGLLTLLALSAGLGVYTAKRNVAREPVLIPGMLWPDPKVIRPFTVVDHNGAEFSREDIIDHWSFLFFGYTNCPDICPLTLSVMSDVQNSLLQDSTDIQTLFVTVDPQRDTAEKLKQYVNYFNKGFIGLGGDRQQVDSLTTQLGIPWHLNETDDSGFYLVDHSASLFLADPGGRLVAVFSAPHDRDSIIERFMSIRNFIDTRG